MEPRGVLVVDTLSTLVMGSFSIVVTASEPAALARAGGAPSALILSSISLAAWPPAILVISARYASTRATFYVGALNRVWELVCYRHGFTGPGPYS